MKTYARIENGVVVELFASDADPGKLFHSSLHWMEAPSGVAESFLFDGTRFTAPPLSSIIPIPTLADLQERLAVLTAEIAALSQMP